MRWREVVPENYRAAYTGTRRDFSRRAAEIAASPDFRSWFSGSKLARGTTPTLFFHGTLAGFRRFDPSFFFSQCNDDGADCAGFYFSTSAALAARYASDNGRRIADGRIVAAFLRAARPYEVTAQDWAEGRGLSPTEARDAGHDAYLIRGQERGLTAVVFRDEDIWQIGDRRPTQGGGLLTESAPRTLYHGTLKRNLPSIMRDGLRPSLGDFTRTMYWEYEEGGIELDDLVFAADRQGLQKCVNAIFAAMEHAGLKATVEAFFEHGAIVVLKAGEDAFQHRPEDEDRDSYDDHPVTVEPNDYYSDSAVVPDFALTGDRLRSFLRRNGVVVDYHFVFDRQTAVAELIRRAKQAHPDRNAAEIVDRARALDDRDVKRMLRNYRA